MVGNGKEKFQTQKAINSCPTHEPVNQIWSLLIRDISNPPRCLPPINKLFLFRLIPSEVPVGKDQNPNGVRTNAITTDRYLSHVSSDTLPGWEGVGWLSEIGSGCLWNRYAPLNLHQTKNWILNLINLRWGYRKKSLQGQGRGAGCEELIS